MELRFVAPIASAAAATPVFALHPESATVSARTATTAVMVRIGTPVLRGQLQPARRCYEGTGAPTGDWRRDITASPGCAVENPGRGRPPIGGRLRRSCLSVRQLSRSRTPADSQRRHMR